MSKHKHTNRLINETSPYLLQHAHNPVDWYPWGEEAFERAKKEDKPMLVSIGYSACHWCHVMERESFENEETAAMMNEHFINIKIDREERPDIDHIYMDAVQAMSGSGGWPLNIFLTPDSKPFYGGTYFPPVRAYNRSSWQEVLVGVSKAYAERKHEIESQAENLTQHLKNANVFGNTDLLALDNVFDKSKLEEIATNILKASDKTWGGFGNAPKFPQTFVIQYLLKHYHFAKDKEVLNQALLSLDKMIYGGIYDQLGGGFARYSTDEKWLAPHFEKMLYDNALLIGVLSEAYQITKNELYSNTIQHTIAFIEREMMSEAGAFYSALDADSEGVEGKFYTWSKEEINSILLEEAMLFCEFYNIQEEGNWEHTNILWITNPIEQFAILHNISIEHLSQQFQKNKDLLLAERSKRIRPQLDDKILLGWNALMIIALCKTYAAIGLLKFKEMALKSIGCLEKIFIGENGDWKHTYKNGIAKYPAFLDDYAYLISAYIHLQEITGNQEFLVKAKKVTEIVLKNFCDEESGLFFFTGISQKDIIIRKREVHDGAMPSGNSIMAINLYYLGYVFDQKSWVIQAKKMIGQFEKAIVRYPTSFGVWSALYYQISNGTREIAIIGKSSQDLLTMVLSEYLPDRVLQASIVENNDFPLLKGKELAEETLIYYCNQYSCMQPVKSVKELKMLLK